MYLDEKKFGEAPVKTKKLAPWRQLLLNSADLLERVGWCQNKLFDQKGRVCILGAMEIKGSSYSRTFFQAEKALMKQIGRFPEMASYLAESRPVAVWQDMPGRTMDEVLFLMRDTAING